ncbi:hypothetical protein GSI_12031 [Ganoderma sinense ZZ0214-1]|uniref:BTB domain-containing protein n=1 Tax=Ganoderma sinense ZZ0214-1 TaxID=1077348 RepID=A0A2G8RXN3_9APHY|nr:hypothetical protein GSI_12031 [Ganoderma sinense ZZ0214-1]
MSSPVTRKRTRSNDEDEEDIPLAKRGSAPNSGEGAATNSLPQAAGSVQTDGQGTDGEEQDGEFWFDDGTVILVAGGIKFRVYEGLLAGLSPVFKAMFVEGRALCNVYMGEVLAVHVLDAPEDLRYLLRVCFSRRLGSLYEERSPSYHEISAAIRLGAKYKVPDLYTQSLTYLKRYFPSTFDNWLALSVYGPPGWDMVENLGAINLARFTGELSILPSAFVACICAAGPETTGLAHGIGRRDGSREHLSPDDLTICFNGKTSLRAAAVTAFLRTIRPLVSRDCSAVSTCKRALRNVHLNLEQHVEGLLDGNPFAQYEMKFFEKQGGLGICESCAAMVRERSAKERRDVWNRLPELLGIDVPGWKDQPA